MKNNNIKTARTILNKLLLTIVLLLLTNISIFSQFKNFNFVVKKYEKCNNQISLENVNNLTKGDKVFIIQMNGAVIDRSNTEKYGDIIDFNGAGQYEFNEILSIKDNDIILKYVIKEGYDFTASIQLIKINNEKSLVVNQNPEVNAWNGKTGGILVLYAEESITLNSDIDVSGKGFRGGSFYNSKIDFANTELSYFYKFNSDLSGNKGEGIVIQDNNYAAGKGKNANGGGGGNAHNAGGGGGGNLAFGGQGGDPYKQYGFGLQKGRGVDFKENGLGGGIKNYQNYPLIMGGGGGSGHYNNNIGADGENGGGIIVIKTKQIIANNFTLKSNGKSVNKISGIDAAGGGGGGGSILLDVEKIENDYLFIDLYGGKGGNSDSRGSDGIPQKTVCLGVGGGGSGGTFYHTANYTGTSITDLNGGKSGLMIDGHDSCRYTSNGATDGEMGKVFKLESKEEQELFEYKDYYFDIKEITSCNSQKKYLSIKNLDLDEIVLWEDGSNENNLEITSTNIYKVTITNKDKCKFNLDTIVEIKTDNISGIEVLEKKNYKLLGDAKNYYENNILLTENKSIKAGVVWCTEKLNVVDDFITSFSFKVYNGNNNKMAEYSQPGADGFALIFQNFRIDNVGGIGGGIGYTGIPNSLAFELDLYGNYLSLDNIYDPNGNHLAIFSNKEKPNIANHKSDALIAEKDNIIEIMTDSTTYYLTLSYKLDEKRLDIKIDNNINSSLLILENFDFAEFIKLDQNKYTYIGISSATGTAAQTHELLNWSICGELTDKITSVKDDYLVNNLGIDQLIYPNPLTELLNINNSYNFNELLIYNSIGELVLNLDISNKEKISLEFGKYSKGLYFYKLIQNDNVKFGKFVKE